MQILMGYILQQQLNLAGHVRNVNMKINGMLTNVATVDIVKKKSMRA